MAANSARVMVLLGMNVPFPMPLMMLREASSSMAALFAWFLMSVNVVPGAVTLGTFTEASALPLLTLVLGFEVFLVTSPIRYRLFSPFAARSMATKA